MLYLAKQTTHKGGFLMKSITQDIKYYQAILSYADQHGVTKAAIKYRTYRQFIYRLRNRYDGTPESLAPKSRRPIITPTNTQTGRSLSFVACANVVPIQGLFASGCVCVKRVIHAPSQVFIAA